jgi:hypothetical protein
MRTPNDHLSDEKLVLFADGEIRGREETNVREHLAACWSCRMRFRELDDAATDFARSHREDLSLKLPPADGPRALLKARLREVAEASRGFHVHGWKRAVRVYGVLWSAVTLALLAVVWLLVNPEELNAIPRSDLTPGAARQVSVSDVCGVKLADNGQVLPAIQRAVFAEYGMPNAEARAYEVDYLITPALGGSDDIRNLWPQPYSGSPWNAYVKDALEDRLRQMVCAGQLDLTTAQREIAVNWVAAYKKYFVTSRPLPEHPHFRPE